MSKNNDHYKILKVEASIASVENEDAIFLFSEDVYIKVLEELLPSTSGVTPFFWMENMMINLKKKYGGISDTFAQKESDKDKLTEAGALAAALLKPFIPNDPTKNMKYAKIIIKKDQNILEIYEKLLTIPEVIIKLNDFVKKYNISLTSDDVKSINQEFDEQQISDTKNLSVRLTM